MLALLTAIFYVRRSLSFFAEKKHEWTDSVTTVRDSAGMTCRDIAPCSGPRPRTSEAMTSSVVRRAEAQGRAQSAADREARDDARLDLHRTARVQADVAWIAAMHAHMSHLRG